MDTDTITSYSYALSAPSYSDRYRHTAASNRHSHLYAYPYKHTASTCPYRHTAAEPHRHTLLANTDPHAGPSLSSH